MTNIINGLEIIQTERGKGKTTQIMQRFIDDKKSILLVINTVEQKRLIDFYRVGLTNFDISRIVTFEQYQNNKTRGCGFERIFIDNADILFQSLFREPIELITISK